MSLIPMPLPIPINGNVDLSNTSASEFVIVTLLFCYIASFVIGVVTGSFDDYHNDPPFPNIASVIFFTFPIGWVCGYILFTKWWQR